MRVKRKQSNSRHRGFTLIEVLVVVAIIALLVAVLIPSLAQARKQARHVLCRAHLSEWAKIWAMDVQTHKESFSQGAFEDTADDWIRGEWITRLRSLYITKSEIIRCPLATQRRPGVPHGGTFNSYYMPPEKNSTKGGGEEPSYGVNCWIYNPPADKTDIQNRPTANNWRRPGAAKFPNRVPVFADCMWRGGGPTDGTAADKTPKKATPPQEEDAYSGSNYEMEHFCMNRHEGYINMLFMDWSVRRVGVRELWKLKWHRNFNTSGPYTRAGGATPDGANWPNWMRRFRLY